MSPCCIGIIFISLNKFEFVRRFCCLRSIQEAEKKRCGKMISKQDFGEPALRYRKIPHVVGAGELGGSAAALPANGTCWKCTGGMHRVFSEV